MNMSQNEINVSLPYSGAAKAKTLIFEKLLLRTIIKVNAWQVSS